MEYDIDGGGEPKNVKPDPDSVTFTPEDRRVWPDILYEFLIKYSVFCIFAALFFTEFAFILFKQKCERLLLRIYCNELSTDFQDPVTPSVSLALLLKPWCVQVHIEDATKCSTVQLMMLWKVFGNKL